MAQERINPVFLERRSYRRRRMMDAVRLLPLVGLFLWMIPVLWPVTDVVTDVVTEAGIDAAYSVGSDAVGVPVDATAAGSRVAMSRAMIFVFAVWVSLILAAGALWAGLRGFARETDPNAAGAPLP